MKEKMLFCGIDISKETIDENRGNPFNNTCEIIFLILKCCCQIYAGYRIFKHQKNVFI